MSICAGSIPAARMLRSRRPVVGPNIWLAAPMLSPMPVSNSTRCRPVFTITAFCSSSALAGSSNALRIIAFTSPGAAPTKESSALPSGSAPSETTVTS